MGAERRRHERRKFTTIVHYRKGVLSGTEQTVTKDISAGGLCFFSEKKLRLGGKIKIRIFNDKKTPDKVIKGRIVWTKEYNDSVIRGYLNGFSFLHS